MTSFALVDSTSARVIPAETVPPARRPRAVLAVVLGVIGVAVTAAGSWIPSYWGDEAASVLSAERSLPSLFALLGHVDAVHGTYYLFLHFWIGAFGASPFSTRFPSALAVGVIVAGVFLIGDLMASRAVGIIGAIVCAVLPRVNFFGGEARSYPFSTLVAVMATLLLVGLLRRQTTRLLPWLGYGLLLAAGVYLFLYIGFLIPVHGLFVLASRRFRPRLRHWLVAVLVALVLALPILVIGYQQRDQISFLSSRRHLNYRSVFIYQWLGNGYLATLVWALVLVAIIGAVILWRRRGARSDLVVLATIWVVVPCLLLGAISLMTPTYDVRYLSMGAPPVALLVACGIVRLPRWPVRVAAVIAVVALAAPTDVGQRGPDAYNDTSDWSRVSTIIGADAHPGDAVVFDATTRPSQRPRLALRLYPAGFAGLKDVELKQRFSDRTTLWDATYPLGTVTSRLKGIRTVWLLEQEDTVDFTAGTNIFTLQADGYTQKLVATVGALRIYRFTRT